MGETTPVDAAVFTTLRWEDGCVAWLEHHLNRLKSHAERLGIEWPSDFHDRLAKIQPSGNGNLCQIRLSKKGEIELTLRLAEYSPSPLAALSQAAPRFTHRAQGTKHASWDGYSNARLNAINHGADIGLLVHEGAVVDGDRCTPILLDIDGVAFAPSPEGGGIDSITLDILKPAIEAAGIPFRYARLTETLLGRAAEIIVVGTGVGVAWLSEIDGQSVGKGSPGPLFEICTAAFETELDGAWTSLEVVQ
jgi:4-amino-4-deoxychorismate lyase